MNVSVCMCATRADTIGAAVRSIANQTHREWELIVVAQGPQTRRITEVVRRELGHRDGRVVPLGGRGASRARNAGVAAASGELIAMTDDDCEAAPDWLEVLVARLRAAPQVGIIGGPVVAPPRVRRGPASIPTCSPIDVLYEPILLGHQQPDGFEWLTSNVAFTRATFETVGPFDEFLGAGGARFPAAEDIDFQYRAVERKVPMLTTADAVVHHTYGWRYGFQNLWAHQRHYARGNGGFNGKLTLLGDPHGIRMVCKLRRMAAVEWLQRRSPGQLPIGIRRYYHYAAAYRECLRDFRVDDKGLLRKKVNGEGSASRHSGWISSQRGDDPRIGWRSEDDCAGLLTEELIPNP